MSKKVSFVILTWKRANMLKICIPKLIESIQNKNDCEIIIFDNASNDDTEALLKDLVSEFSSQIDIKYYISDKNLRLLAYKKLFKMATGDIVIEVDDDVLAYPTAVDQVFIKYFDNFKNFGFLALDVIQNEHTNGSKPESHHYTDVTVNGLTVESGPTGGWCAGFRAKDFKKISWLFNMMPLTMKSGEDGALQHLFKLFGKKSGIIKDQKCFHASGSFYSKQFDQLERDVEKYQAAGLDNFVQDYTQNK